MSERLPGQTVITPAPAKPRDAAAVILVRGEPGRREVYWMRREKAMAFAGGFYAFPGGRLDPQDNLVPVEGAEGGDAALRVAAARELFEETGVLMVPGAETLTAVTLNSAREGLVKKTLRFPDFLQRHHLKLKASDFGDAGRWITPPFLPTRFDARFFWVEAPRWAKPENWPGEAAEAGWISPAAAIERWGNGTALLHPPNLHAMQTLLLPLPTRDALAVLRTPSHCPNGIATRIEFQRGIRMFPLETPTLPPAAHTNAYVLGNGELLVVDPGSSEVRQYARLLALVSGLQAEGKRCKAIVLTHHHGDHIGGTVAVAERLRVPIWAHAMTADRVPFPVQKTLEDGEVITLAGAPQMKFQVLHTPGHAQGHIVLVEEVSRAGVVGDMVSGLSTIVIDPPEGNMKDYLDQLRRLRDVPLGTLYPSHGPALPDGVEKLNEYLRHRELRERRVGESVKKQGSALAEIVAAAYTDVDPSIHPIAERNALAILIKLMEEGRIRQEGDRYFLNNP